MSRCWRALLAPLLAAALLTGCAAPANTQAVPPRAASPTRATPVKVDTSCTSDAQCVVKNVGSCCGEMPACVNVDSPTDPAAVQAQCQASGRMGICGFRQISACQCQAGTCQPAGNGAGSLNPSGPVPIR